MSFNFDDPKRITLWELSCERKKRSIHTVSRVQVRCGICGDVQVSPAHRVGGGEP
jgi:hypothetical protein